MLFLRFSCFKELAFLKERLLQSCWEMGLQRNSPPQPEMGSRIGQRNSLSLMPPTGMVASRPGTCCSAGDQKMMAFSDGELDSCKWDAVAERLRCPSDAPQDPRMQRDFQQHNRAFQKCGVLVLRARRCLEKPGRKAEPKE